jgi:hypothetical protein
LLFETQLFASFRPFLDQQSAFFLLMVPLRTMLTLCAIMSILFGVTSMLPY